MAGRAVEAAIISPEEAQFQAPGPAVSVEYPSNVLVFPGHAEPVDEQIPPIKNVPVLRRAHWPDRFATPQEGIFRAMEQLKGLDAPKRVLNALFNKHGEYRLRDKSGKDTFAMEADEAFEHIIGVYRPLLQAVEYYLDEPNTKTRPYNAHGENHLRNTYNSAIELLRHSGHLGKPDRFRRRSFMYPRDLSPDKIENHTAHVAAYHDGGYFIDPETHPDRSIEVAEQTTPQVLNHPEEWEHISRAIRLHEGDNLRAELLAAGVTTHAGVIDFLAHEYPYVPAMILADKADQNRGRVRGGELLESKSQYTDPKSFLTDPHVEANLLTQINYIDWEHDANDPRTGMPMTSFKIRIDFDQTVTSKDEQKKFKYFLVEASRAPGVKLDVSEQTRTVFNQGSNRKDYFDSLVERNLEIGTPRLLNVVLCSFALNPEQEKAEIVFRDAQRGREIRQSFYRDTIDEDIAKFWNAYVPEKARQKRGENELKI